MTHVPTCDVQSSAHMHVQKPRTLNACVHCTHIVTRGTCFEQRAHSNSWCGLAHKYRAKVLFMMVSKAISRSNISPRLWQCCCQSYCCIVVADPLCYLCVSLTIDFPLSLSLSLSIPLLFSLSLYIYTYIFSLSFLLYTC